jgi:sugar/nucleoside kinase (ribokinase family)
VEHPFLPDFEPVIVVAGHICLDVHVKLGSKVASYVDLLAPGKLIEVGAAQFAMGGPVPNTGLTLHRLGLPVRLVGKVGADVLGGATMDVLRSHGERLADEMIVSQGDDSSYTIVISPPGVDRCFLHFPGANHTFRASDIQDKHLAGAAWLHFGYPPLMRTIYERDGAELVTIFERAHKAGLVTSLDMAVPDPNAPSGRVDWPRWLENVLPHVDVFMPSLDETMFMLDGRKGMSDDPRDVAERLMGWGAAIVALKLGEDGLYVRSKEERRAFGRFPQAESFDIAAWLGGDVHMPCFQVEVCGTTGSGDATIAGFIAAMLKGLDPQHAAEMAVAVGACSVEAADASSGVPTWQEVGRRVAAGWPRRQ